MFQRFLGWTAHHEFTAARDSAVSQRSCEWLNKAVIAHLTVAATWTTVVILKQFLITGSRD